MRPVNLIVIDDDMTYVERAMKYLKRHDRESLLGEYIVDDTILSIEKIEDYSPSTYGIEFDAVLIDYQLNKEFTGVLVSAWIMLQLHIPRITLTTATYTGPKNYFDEFIRKDEITDNPNNVIHKIVSCISNFNYSQWLDNQYKELVGQYNDLLAKSERNTLIPHEEEMFKKIGNLLDKFERILDTQQEERIKTKLEYLKTKMLL